MDSVDALIPVRILKPFIVPRVAAYALGLLAIAFFCVTLAVPLARLLVGVPEGLREVTAHVQELAYFMRRFWITLLQGFMGALLCALLGLPAAAALWLVPLKNKALWGRVLLLPFLVPVVVVALSTRALAYGLGWAEGDNTDAFFIPWALFAGFIFYNTGLLVWMVWNALERIPMGLLYAGQSLGAGYGQLLRYVVWPLVRPAVASALAWVFLFCAGSFGLSLLLGGAGWATLEVEIYILATRELNVPVATVLALAQFAWSALVVWLALRYENKQYGGRASALALDAPVQSGSGNLYRFASKSLQCGVWLSLLAVLLCCAAPLVALLLASVHIGGVWTLRAYQNLWIDESGHFIPAVLNTLRFVALGLPLAALMALGTAVLAVWLPAWLAARTHSYKWLNAMLAGFVGLLAYLPYLISASILSLALLLSYPQWVGSVGVLVAAYALLAYPLMTRQLVQAWRQRTPQLLWAAESLGAPPWAALRHGVWPQIAPAWRSGLALAAASMLGEFAVTLFLSRPEWMTLSTLIYHLMGKAGAVPLAEAHAASVLLLVLAVLVFTLLQHSPNRVQTGQS